MTGTRGIGRRRGTRGKTVLVNGIPEGATVNHEPAHAATQVIEPVTPSLAQDLADGLEAAERGLTEDLGSFAGYTREAVPDLFSADPADRTEWFLLAGGTEPLFEALVTEQDAEYLLDTSLPVPPQSAPETTEAPDPGPEDAPPPAGESAAETTPAPDPSPEPSGPVSTEDGEPVQDEPEAEPDCGETGGVA